MAQYGFHFNQTECIGCRTCRIAFKDKNRLEIGELLRNVHSYETGEFPKPGIYHLADTCHHCDDPACVEACPSGRTQKDANTGIVFYAADTKCLGEACQACVKSCPYGHPAFQAATNTVKKCDMCYDLILNGEEPACVAACMTRALKFGLVEELKERYGADLVTDLPCLPVDTTGSNFLINPRKCVLDKEFEEKHI